MGKKPYLLTVVLAVAAGFAGGVVASWIRPGLPVLAQQTAEQAKVIRAERFEVVDKDGKSRVELGIAVESEKPYLRLAAKDAKSSAALDPFGLKFSTPDEEDYAELNSSHLQFSLWHG